MAIPERMAFIPVFRGGAVDSLVDSLKNEQTVTGANEPEKLLIDCFKALQSLSKERFSKNSC